jgi:hypothetical protein
MFSHASMTKTLSNCGLLALKAAWTPQAGATGPGHDCDAKLLC